MSDDRPKALRKRALQSPGNLSKVYVPVITKIFRERHRKGASSIIFSLDDVRNACDALGVASRNPADVIYRMRSRTILPAEILKLGFHVLRPIGRGKYAFEKASSTIFEPPFTKPVTTIDLTPMPVRRQIPVIFPIEAKALADALNRVQIFNMVQYAEHYFPGLTVRPLAIKVDEASVLHIVEFNSPKKTSELKILKAASYIIDTSEAQIAAIRSTNVPKQ